MESISLLLETVKIFKIKCIGKMTRIFQKNPIIKVKNCKVKITNGMQRMISFFYITSVPKLINLKNVTFVKIIKMKLLKKLSPKIMSTQMEKFLRKKQNIKRFGDGLKLKDLPG